MPKRNLSAEIISLEEGILDDNLKNSREERRANGRMVALIVAIFLIFLAIYHVWIRKTAVVAGALVPALIMVLYGGWVVFLAKREKKRKQMLEQKMGEKLSEKGSEFGTQENLIIQPIKPAVGIMKTSTTSKPTMAVSIAENTGVPKKKLRHKRHEGRNPEEELRTIASKLNARSNLKNHIFGPNAPTEGITKLRQERTPLCRTISAP